MILHRRAIRLLYASLLSAGAIYANGQTCDGKNAGAIATDRPQVTNSSIVVPCGSLQFENGLEQSGSARRQGFDLPETSIRLGIAKRLELRFAPPIYFNNVDSGSAFASGGGDSVLGLKLQLGPVHGFDVSVIPSVSLPTGTSAISSHGYDPALQIPWSRSLTKVWTVAGQLSVLAPTQGSTRNVSGQASLYFDRALGSVWDAYLEYSGQFAEFGGPQHILDFGAAYKISPHQQLDLHANFGFAAASPSHAIGVGYSVRFQVIRTRK